MDQPPSEFSPVTTENYNKGLTSTNRLLQFVVKDVVLAKYIWSFNFNTEHKRFGLH